MTGDFRLCRSIADNYCLTVVVIDPRFVYILNEAEYTSLYTLDAFRAKGKISEGVKHSNPGFKYPIRLDRFWLDTGSI